MGRIDWGRVFLGGLVAGIGIVCGGSNFAGSSTSSAAAMGRFWPGSRLTGVVSAAVAVCGSARGDICAACRQPGPAPRV